MFSVWIRWSGQKALVHLTVRPTLESALSYAKHVARDGVSAAVKAKGKIVKYFPE